MLVGRGDGTSRNFCNSVSYVPCPCEYVRIRGLINAYRCHFALRRLDLVVETGESRTPRPRDTPIEFTTGMSGILFSPLEASVGGISERPADYSCAAHNRCLSSSTPDLWRLVPRLQG